MEPCFKGEYRVEICIGVKKYPCAACGGVIPEHTRSADVKLRPKVKQGQMHQVMRGYYLPLGRYHIPCALQLPQNSPLSEFHPVRELTEKCLARIIAKKMLDPVTTGEYVAHVLGG